MASLIARSRERECRASSDVVAHRLVSLVDGWSQSTVSLIESGQHDTLFDIRKLLAFADAVDMAGWAAFDHGDQRLARRLYGEAQLLAASSGDIEPQTQLWSNMSMQNTYLATTATDPGLAREGLRLANLAENLAKHQPSPRLHALIALRQAMAYAQLGDVAGFRAAITQARRELDRGPHPADPPWCGFVIEAEITGHEAGGMMRLGFHDRSVALYGNVIDDGRLTPRNRACWEASLAGALLDAGDRTQALTRGRSIIPALSAGNMSSARPLARLRGLREAANEVGDEEFCVLYDTATRSLAG